MRKIIRLLLIFAAAIATAFLLTALAKSSVSFSIFEKADYTMNMNVFIILTLLSFFTLYVLIRLISGFFHLPERTKQWNLLRKERYSNDKLNQATLQYFAGRYSRSLKNVKKSLKHYEKDEQIEYCLEERADFLVLSHLLGAANEHRLGDKNNSTSMVQKALLYAKRSKTSEAADGLQLLKIEWLIDNDKLEDARAVLKELDPGVANRIAALQLQLKLDRMQNQPLSALKTVKLLARHNAYTPDETEMVIIESAQKVLENTHDTQELQKAWDSLSKKEKKIPSIIAYAARHFAILGDTKSAHKMIESAWRNLDSIEPKVKQNILMTLDMTLENADSSWLSRLEKTLQSAPEDAMVTYLAGRLCHVQGVTGKAQALLEKAARDTKLPILLRQRAWFIIAQEAETSGELEQANAYYKEVVGLLPSQP